MRSRCCAFLAGRKGLSAVPLVTAESSRDGGPPNLRRATMVERQVRALAQVGTSFTEKSSGAGERTQLYLRISSWRVRAAGVAR